MTHIHSQDGKRKKNLYDYFVDQPKNIDHSDKIYHFKQIEQQCWTRSSQMFLSFILFTLGLSKDEISIIFYHNLFLDNKYLNDILYQNNYLELNQLLLGRRLRKNTDEKVILTLDELFVKVYAEFGSMAFSAEVFAAFIKNFLQTFSRMTERFQNATITLIIDNDKDKEEFSQRHSCTFNYKTFKLQTDSKIITGMISGQDKKLWTNMTNNEKTNLISDLLQISPILAEIPGHAFVITGIDHDNSKLTINDSLSNDSYQRSISSILNSLTAFVMITEISFD